MATFTARVRTPLHPAEAGARLLDPQRHTRAIPLTTVTGTMDVAGGRFVARTAVGPWGFDDPMLVRSVHVDDDGARLVVAKTGRVVRGHVDARVRPCRGGSEVTWHQQIAVGRLPRALDPLVAAVARVAYGAALRRVVR